MICTIRRIMFQLTISYVSIKSVIYAQIKIFIFVSKCDTANLIPSFVANVVLVCLLYGDIMAGCGVINDHHRYIFYWLLQQGTDYAND